MCINLDGHLACEKLEAREGGGMLQDKRHDANGRLEDELAQRERAEVRKVQCG